MCCGNGEWLEIDNGWVNRSVYLDFSGLNACFVVLCGLASNTFEQAMFPVGLVCHMKSVFGMGLRKENPLLCGDAHLMGFAVGLFIHHRHVLSTGRLKTPRPSETHQAEAGSGASCSGPASAGQ